MTGWQNHALSVWFYQTFLKVTSGIFFIDMDRCPVNLIYISPTTSRKVSSGGLIVKLENKCLKNPLNNIKYLSTLNLK